MQQVLTKRELARVVLDQVFAERSRVPIAEVLDAGRLVGVSRRTLTRVGAELGVREVHNGPYGAFWERPWTQ